MNPAKCCLACAVLSFCWLSLCLLSLERASDTLCVLSEVHTAFSGMDLANNNKIWECWTNWESPGEELLMYSMHKLSVETPRVVLGSDSSAQV